MCSLDCAGLGLRATKEQSKIGALGSYAGRINERDLLAKCYEAAVPDNRISPKKSPAVANLQMALDLLADENPKAKVAKPEDFVDNVLSKSTTTAPISTLCTSPSRVKRTKSITTAGCGI